MKTQIYSVRHNNFQKKGFAEIQSIEKGLREIFVCRQCAEYRPIRYADGAIDAICDPEKGTKWPDVIKSGGYPFFIVSSRVLAAFKEEGIGDFPAHPVLIQQSLFKRLTLASAPRYFWLDGKKMMGAKLDFEASGYVDVRFCPACGTMTNDMTETDKRQHSGQYPHSFLPDTWNGANLFTTDLSHCAFYCTEAVIACARKHKLTNFRFVPIEERFNFSHKGLDYI